MARKKSELLKALEKPPEYLFLHFVPQCSLSVSGGALLRCCMWLSGRALTPVEGAHLFNNQDLITHRESRLIFTDWTHENLPHMIMSFVLDEKSGKYMQRWMNINEGALSSVLTVRIRE